MILLTRKRKESRRSNFPDCFLNYISCSAHYITDEFCNKGVSELRLVSFVCALAIALSSLVFKAEAYEFPEVSAKGAILIDAATGEILYEKNAYEQLPMASTTKIMSALLALEHGNLDEQFVVDKEAIQVEGSSMGLQEGDIVTLRTLVCGMLLPSGNDAANCAAVRVAGSVEAFVQLMNERAVEMGLTSTHFVTPSGLDDYTDEHYSTAYDMAVLTREALKNEDFREICGKTNIKVEFGNPPYERWLTNTNKLLTMCDGVIGVKTGFTDKARRCLVSACERDGATLICVTLNDPDDWIDHTRMFDYGFALMSKQELPLDTDTFEIGAVGGTSDTILCKTDTAKLMLPEGKAENVTCEIFIVPFVYCPAAENVHVGRVEYYYNGQLIAQKPIYTAQSVGKSAAEPESGGFWQGCIEKVKDLFD